MRIDRKYLPSSKFLVSLALAIVLILVAIALNYSKSNRITRAGENLVAGTSSTSIIASLNNIDTDKDTVPDWQEVLYGTDPKNADTDKDGTSDGEEIKINRDPLKANTATKNQEPSDKIDPQLIASEQKISADYESLNPIEKMARNLVSNIFAAQPVNGEMDQATKDSLVQKAIEDLPQKQFYGITKGEDLNFINPDPKTFNTNLLVYAKNYYVQTEAFRKIMGRDLAIINDALSNGKLIEKEKIGAITSKYQEIINNLIKMPIPSTPKSYGSFYHLMVINGLEILIQIDNDMIKFSDDSSSLFSDLSEYNKTLNNIVLMLSNLDIVLRINR